MSHKQPALFLFLVLAIPACQKSYRADTVVHPDGSVERVICQPKDTIPEMIQRQWEKRKFIDAAPFEREGWPESLRELLAHPRAVDGDAPYFIGSGKFKSVKQIPEHVRFNSDLQVGLPPGKLDRDCAITDYVFVVEYRWRETLTDIVRLDDMRQARAELADLLIRLAEEIFQEALGREYDATRLFQWLRTEGKAALDEITDFAFVHCASRKGWLARQQLWEGIAAICTRRGLPIDHKETNDKIVGQQLEEFAVDQLCRHVRRKKDDKPLDRATATEWLRELLGGDDRRIPSHIFETAAERVMRRRYADPKAFERQLGRLIGRVGGLHLFGYLSNDKFDYALTVPGEVVETTGQIISANRVRWQFDVTEAYPLGYDMACRSLASQAEEQQRLLKRQTLKSREEMLLFVSIVERRRDVLEVLRECRKQKTITPLLEYRKRVQEKPEEINRLFKLLGLPAMLPPTDPGAPIAAASPSRTAPRNRLRPAEVKAD